MGKVVLHMEKGKSGSNGGLTLHVDRLQKEFSKNIDVSKSHLNFELCKITGTIDQMVKERIKQGYKASRTIRKTAVTTCKFILSGSHDDMINMSDKDLKQWSVDNYKFFANRYGEENIIRATVHRDEKTPHMHLILVPITKDGRLSARDFFGDKKQLKQLQTDYAMSIGNKYGLERGISGSNRNHIKTQDYYRYINQNELTAEKIVKHKKSTELVTKLIELADNNQHKLYNHEFRRYRERIRKKQTSRGTNEFEKSEGRNKSGKGRSL